MVVMEVFSTWFPRVEQLRIARYSEPFALLVAQIAYEGDGGPELACRFGYLRQ